MYKNIVVSIDESNTSQKALKQAISIAKIYQSKLSIVHAIDESLILSFATHGATLSNASELRKTMETQGKQLLKSAKDLAEAEGIQVDTHLLAGETPPADQISDFMLHADADLLIAGSHGRRGFKRLLLGSVAENLLRKATTSVLIVRGEIPPPSNS